MEEAEEGAALTDAPPEPVTNFDRLAAALTEGGLAAKLLEAWRSGDESGRVKRMLSVAQPPHNVSTDKPDASED